MDDCIRTEKKIILQLLLTPCLCLVDNQQVVEAKVSVLSKLLALNHDRKTKTDRGSGFQLQTKNELCWTQSNSSYTRHKKLKDTIRIGIRIRIRIRI